MTNVAVVVASNRPEQMFACLDAWADQTLPAKWYVVWDLEEMPAESHTSAWDRQGIKHELGASAWVIPFKTGAIRSFGFLMAYRAGADIIVSLDDDVRPSGPAHLAELVAALDTPVNAEWVGFGPAKQRGIPFDLKKQAPWLHEGGWYGVPDLDAPTRLVAGVHPFYAAPRYSPSVVVPSGQWLALSAMHFAFRRELTPALYQLLMGPEWGFHRFDDIWSGLFAKKVCDHLGQYVTFGEPFVRHEQASNVYDNLVAEAPGIREHERVWRELVALPVSGDCAACAYRSIAEGVRQSSVRKSSALFDDPYWSKLAEAMVVWAGLFPCTGPDYRVGMGTTAFIEEPTTAVADGRCRELLHITPSAIAICALPAGHEGDHSGATRPVAVASARIQ